MSCALENKHALFSLSGCKRLNTLEQLGRDAYSVTNNQKKGATLPKIHRVKFFLSFHDNDTMYLSLNLMTLSSSAVENHYGIKIEKQLMQVLPKDIWGEIGMAISFFGKGNL